MEINTLSDPARYAQAIRDLARDAHRTLTALAIRGGPAEALPTHRSSSRPPSVTAVGARSDLAGQPRARGAVRRRPTGPDRPVPCAFVRTVATARKPSALADDLHISPFREDGVTYGTPTWIWSVAVDDALYVRHTTDRTLAGTGPLCGRKRGGSPRPA